MFTAVYRKITPAEIMAWMALSTHVLMAIISSQIQPTPPAPAQAHVVNGYQHVPSQMDPLVPHSTVQMVRD